MPRSFTEVIAKIKAGMGLIYAFRTIRYTASVYTSTESFQRENQHMVPSLVLNERTKLIGVRIVFIQHAWNSGITTDNRHTVPWHAAALYRSTAKQTVEQKALNKHEPPPNWRGFSEIVYVANTVRFRSNEKGRKFTKHEPETHTITYPRRQCRHVDPSVGLDSK